jgi:putative DNA primase/helicase
LKFSKLSLITWKITSMDAQTIAIELEGKPLGDGWIAHCPAHDDKKASLSIRQNNGKVLVKCHAGCTQQDVINELKARGLWGDNGQEKARVVATYDYVDENKTLLFQVCRFEPKDFRQRRPDGNDGWIWNLKGVRRVLYKLPDIIEAVEAGRPVFIVEGEKDAEKLHGIGLDATTNAGGAGKWLTEYNDYLKNSQVVIIPDNDEPGRKHAKDVAKSLYGITSNIKIIELPDLPETADVSDWFRLNWTTADDLRVLVDSCPPWQPPPEESKITAELISEGLKLSDWGNAKRLVERHGDDLRYCYSTKIWFNYDGVRWVEDTTGETERRAKDTVQQIYAEASEEDNEKERKTIAKHALSSESSAKIRAMLESAQSEPGIPVELKQLDTKEFVLNSLNGTIDLWTGELLPHRREDLLTKICPVYYDPKAKSEVWECFLQRILPNRSVREFVQRAAGYSILGDVREEKIFFPFGPPATGKSTFLCAIQSALGDYATTADFETFLQKRYAGGGPNPEIRNLTGKRIVISLEVEEGRKLAEALISQLSGGDFVAARGLYERRSTEFLPCFTLWLAANNRPRVSDANSAVWRRILQIPFQERIPESERDPQMKLILKNTNVSGPAILSWLVEGALIYQQEGLKIPDEVRNLTQDYRREMDPIGDFCEERCVFETTRRIAVADLYREYCVWFEKSAGPRKNPMSKIRFGKLIEGRDGIDKYKDMHGWYWIGVDILKENR